MGRAGAPAEPVEKLTISNIALLHIQQWRFLQARARVGSTGMVNVWHQRRGVVPPMPGRRVVEEAKAKSPKASSAVRTVQTKCQFEINRPESFCC